MTLSQTTQSGSALFDALRETSSALATAPLLSLAIGVLLLLLVDIIDPLRGARPLVLIGALVTSAFFEIRILCADTAPGAVLMGSYTADATSALWGLLFLAGTALAWAYSNGYYKRAERPFLGEHDALLLTAPAGMMLMVGAGDLLTFFVGLELLSIPLYALCAFRRWQAQSVEAGLKYFLLGSFATGLFLFGAGLVYVSTGTIGLDALRTASFDSPLAWSGAALLAGSLFFKVSVFPFHLWVPDVYQGSPTPVTALMATGTKAAAFGFLLQAMFLVPSQAWWIVGILALATMAVGNFGALAQSDLKRMLAYSGIAHAGNVLLVVAAVLSVPRGADGLLDPETLLAARNAALFYMGAYLFTATGAFGLLSLLESDGERYTRLENLRGLAASRPGIAAGLALFMLSLGGIPATAGFLGKWMVFAVLIGSGHYAMAVAGILLSVVALGYYLRVLVTMYMEAPPEGLEAPRASRPLTAGLATVICSAFVLLMGILPGWFLDRLG